MKRKTADPAYNKVELRSAEVLVPTIFLSKLNQKEDSDYPFLNKLEMLAALSNPSQPYSMEIFLRRYVNDWISTGRDSSNSTSPNWECPKKRDLTKASEACGAVRSFTGSAGVRLEITKWGLHIAFGTSEHYENSAQMEASKQMVLFLQADGSFRYKLARCVEASCGKYFTLTMWKNEFKKGTFCPSCQRARSLQGAKMATRRHRAEALQELYRLAAQRFSVELKTPDWSKRFRERVTKYLTDRIRKTPALDSVYREGVKSSWLSRREHQQGIIQATASLG